MYKSKPKNVEYRSVGRPRLWTQHITERTFNEIPKISTGTFAQPLEATQINIEICQEICAKWYYSITTDIYLNARHGFSLQFHSVSWKIYCEEVTTTVIKRQGLQWIGCDHRRMLKLACNIHDGEVDVAKSYRKIEVRNIIQETSLSFLERTFTTEMVLQRKTRSKERWNVWSVAMTHKSRLKKKLETSWENLKVLACQICTLNTIDPRVP